MSKQQYLKTLNEEIQKLNGIIDHKIMQDFNYKREARRHKKLLRQLRREERSSFFSRLPRLLLRSW